ncbi:hypothetical protein SK128_018682, partial [Halocaridina rubra]
VTSVVNCILHTGKEGCKENEISYLRLATDVFTEIAAYPNLADHLKEKKNVFTLTRNSVVGQSVESQCRHFVFLHFVLRHCLHTRNSFESYPFCQLQFFFRWDFSTFTNDLMKHLNADTPAELAEVFFDLLYLIIDLDLPNMQPAYEEIFKRLCEALSMYRTWHMRHQRNWCNVIYIFKLSWSDMKTLLWGQGIPEAWL